MTKRKPKLFESTIARKPGANGTGPDIERAVAKAQYDAPPVVPPATKRGAPSTGQKPADSWQARALATTKAKGRKAHG